jgi:hypothetical protein
MMGICLLDVTLNYGERFAFGQKKLPGNYLFLPKPFSSVDWQQYFHGTLFLYKNCILNIIILV